MGGGHETLPATQILRGHARAMLVALCVALGVGAPVRAYATLNKTELKCSQQLAKGAQRLANVVFREMSRCRTARILGTSTQVCPQPRSQAKIDKMAAVLEAAAMGSCGSTCSISGLPCLSDGMCPPVGSVAESCTAGVENRPFDLSKLGFPGPFCETLLGRPILVARDVSACVIQAVTGTGYAAVDGLLGALPDQAGLSKGAATCLDAAISGGGKLIRTAFRTATKCRDGINKAKKKLNILTCVDDDPASAKKIAKAQMKLRDFLRAKCTGPAFGELDVCATGVGTTFTVIQASDCIVALSREIADSTAVPAERAFSAISFLDAAYPPPHRCGDNLVNQLPNPFLLLGEECDGPDDGACPGQCLPPGDLFECTCGNRPRLRFFASSEGSETDAGWTGLSHNQLAADLSGFVVDVSNCNCSAFSQATCVGATSDPICDLYGATKPVCSHSPTSSQRCDEFGDSDGADEDEDCAVCDAFSANAGASCRTEADCQSRCYDSAGVAQGACTAQLLCPAGQVCRGRCDKTQYCIRTPNGAPLPVNSAGAAVCGIQTFRSDVAGTLNLVTGAHEISFQLFSQIHTGESISRPCPVCGGFCVGGSNANQVCSGSCSDSRTPCRFDDDCPGNEQCTGSSTDCPGGTCELSLVCGVNPATNPALDGQTCRISAEHKFFGTISNDCLPASASNTTGRGLEIDYLPWTSGTLTLPSTLACTAPGFELYECPCSDDGGQPSKPNECAPACNAAGPNFGVGCADGNSSGQGTRCAGGPNAGRLCDDNADCPSSSCSVNPTHCEGDPAFARYVCATNADCGLGSCVNACPAGRCVPLCVPTPGDPFDGQCAAGPPTYHCDGKKYLFKSCAKASVGAGCAAVCSHSGTPCVGRDDCPLGETCQGECAEARDCEAGSDGKIGNGDDFRGAGRCIGDIRSCFLNPIVATGGTTLSGNGGPTNMSTVGLFCQKKSVNTGANAGAGFGGPTRVRVRGANVPNFTSLP
jgi:hypothetical protein